MRRLEIIGEGAKSEPLLYLSLCLKQHRDWLSWIRFFLWGVRETSTSATDTARRIMALFAAVQAALTVLSDLGLHTEVTGKQRGGIVSIRPTAPYSTYLLLIAPCSTGWPPVQNARMGRTRFSCIFCPEIWPAVSRFRIIALSGLRSVDVQ